MLRQKIYSSRMIAEQNMMQSILRRFLLFETLLRADVSTGDSIMIPDASSADRKKHITGSGLMMAERSIITRKML